MRTSAERLMKLTSSMLSEWTGQNKTFFDAEATRWALAHSVGEEMREGGLYATLNEEGVPVHCDFETWQAWMFRDLEKRQTKIRCSPDVEATITFTGQSPPEVSLDGRAKFWSVSFYSAARNEHFGWGPGVFATKEQAQGCVARYIAKGCPPPGNIDWFST